MKLTPVFMCTGCNVPAHKYKNSPNDESDWIVRCTACGAKAYYDQMTHEVEPHPVNKGRPNYDSIVLDGFVDEKGNKVMRHEDNKGVSMG